jgi:SAM-dependent methyltransferase
MPRFHPESPDIDRQALARLRFVADFRRGMHSGLSKGNRALYDLRHADMAAGPTPGERRDRLRAAMEAEPFYQTFSSLLRGSQDLMWRLVGEAVDADLDRMAVSLKALSNQALGSVRVDSDLALPDYVVREDVHRMPGGYAHDAGPEDIRAGALYDLGGAVYQFGIGNMAGGLLNDSRGRAILANLSGRFPDFEPRAILDMGCGVGQNTVPIAQAFPDARTHGIDVGASLIRYAHLRAEGLGARVHFSQDDAEHTRFADASFDLVVSQIVLHETSPKAMAAIIRESRRLLRLGGVAVHLEVPLRAENGDDFYNMISLWEEYYNAEPNISGVMDADLIGLASDAGFAEVRLGYQSIPAPGASAAPFSATPNRAGGAQWLVLSGVAA